MGADRRESPLCCSSNLCTLGNSLQGGQKRGKGNERESGDERTRTIAEDAEATPSRQDTARGKDMEVSPHPTNSDVVNQESDKENSYLRQTLPRSTDPNSGDQVWSEAEPGG